MPSQYTLRICDAFGTFLIETAEFLEAGNAPGLRYILNAGNIGSMIVTLPPSYNPLLVKDGRIHIMRSVNGGTAQREGGSCFLIRRWEYADDYTVITAVHANDLMRRRYSLDDPIDGNNSVIGNEHADDSIKIKWKQSNGPILGTSSGAGIATFRGYSTVTTTADQVQADISSYVSVAANLGLAPIIDRMVEWQNVLDIIQGLANYSQEAGTYLTAEIVAPTESTLELQTFINQRGADIRSSTGSGLVFSTSRGNLENTLLVIDALEEITFAEAIGDQPFGSGRYTGTDHDAVRMGESPFGRIEMIVDANNAPNNAGLTAEAQSQVQAGRPKITLTASLIETDNCIRGIHYNYGDFVTVEARGQQYDMHLDVLDVQVSAQTEVAKARFEFTG